MKIILLSLFLFCSLNVLAQVSGAVNDKNEQALPGAVVKLYRGTTTVKILLTDSQGHFAFDGAADQLVVTYTGFLTYTLKSLKPLMMIWLRPDTRILKEVNITSKQPLVRQETDRMVISVNAQVKKLADNALEIVSLAPGITISDNEDAIQMSGKSEVQVMINDKVVKMTAHDLAKMYHQYQNQQRN